MTNKLQLNTDHIWGCYYELIIDENCVQRTVFLEEGGINSLHCHQTEEWMTVISGTVEFTLGKDAEHLQKNVLSEGGTIYVPKNYWHRINYVAGNFDLNGCPCAVINETMLGNHQGGKYKINRLEKAIKSHAPRHVSK